MQKQHNSYVKAQKGQKKAKNVQKMLKSRAAANSDFDIRREYEYHE